MRIERLRFALLNLSRQLRVYASTILLSIMLIFFISTIFLLSDAIKTVMLDALESEPDFVVQRIQGERVVPMRASIGEALIEIPGTLHTAGRVWGRYRFPNSQYTVLLLGIDFLDEQAHDALAKVMNTIDLNRFMMHKRQMIIGLGVSKWMRQNGRSDLRFFTPDGLSVTLKHFATLPRETDLFGNDLVITHIKTARKILGLQRNEVTDFTLDVPNEIEWDTVPIKVNAIQSDLRIISKKESRKAYMELFDYQNSFFMIAFAMAMIAFMMLLSQRYSTLDTQERRNIAALRAIGWSTGDVLAMKFYETLIWVVLTFAIGYSAAWIYIFGFGAPGLRSIFWGGEIAPLPLGMRIDLFEASSLFLLYAIPFFAASLLPIWRTATTPIAETIR